MKKLLSLIIAVITVLSLPVFSVSAAYIAELSVSKAEAKAGENAEILISIANNPGLCALGFEVAYDSSAVSVVSAQFTDAFASAATRVNTQDGKIIFNAASADNINGDGTVAKIVFKITAASFTGTEITVKPLGETGFVLHSEADHSLVDVSLKLYNGSVVPPAGTVTDAPVTDTPIPETSATACIHANTVSETVKAATCSSKGVALTRCSACGISLGETELPLTEHKAGEWETVTEPTAEKEGEAARKCTACGQILEAKTLDKLTAANTDSASVAVTTESGVSVEPNESNDSTVIIIVIAAVAVAGVLIAFAVFKAKADRRKSEADYL